MVINQVMERGIKKIKNRILKNPQIIYLHFKIKMIDMKIQIWVIIVLYIQNNLVLNWIQINFKIMDFYQLEI